MLSARAILRLLIEDDEPVAPQPPDDPNQSPLPTEPVTDPQQDIARYLDQKPFAVPGTGPTLVYNRMVADLARGRHRGVHRKKIDNHTFLIQHEDARISVRFHDTDVVTATPDGTVIVDSGGWRPGGKNADRGFSMPAGTTTMARINDWLDAGWSIYRLPILRNADQKGEGGNWFWHNRNIQGKWAYTDGDKIMPNGALQPQRYPEPDEFTPVKRRRL